MFDFANNLDRKMAREREDPFLDDALIDRLHKKLEKQVEVYRPNMNDFVEIYGPEMVKKDKAEIQRLEEIFSQEGNSEEMDRLKKVSEITEGIIINNLAGEWLGHQAEATPTSKFDDYKRGVDAVIEFFPEDETNPYEYLGAMIDVTFDQKNTLFDKLDRIWEQNISKGRMTEIKYFEGSEIMGLLKFPRIVLSIAPENVKDLMKLEDKSRRDDIGHHHVQASILYQMQRQLYAYYIYASKNDYPDLERLSALGVNRITDIIEKKQLQMPDFQEVVSSDEGNIAMAEFFDKKGV